MVENRSHLRIRKAFNITWNVIGSQLEGQGNVLNISRSGALIQTDRVFDLKDDPLIRILPNSPGIFFQEKEGAVVWFRRVKTPQVSYLIGLRFTSDTIPDREFTAWLDKAIQEISASSDAKILDHYIK